MITIREKELLPTLPLTTDTKMRQETRNALVKSVFLKKRNTEGSKLDLLLEQAERAKEQAERAKELAKEQAERSYAMQLRLEERVIKFEATVIAKLNNIEKQVLIVKDVVISEFRTMNKTDNENLVELLESAMEAPAVIEQIEAIKSGNPVQVRSQSGVFRNKQYATITTMRAITAFFGSFVKSDYRKQPGQFVARIMRQVTGVDWQSNYPTEFSEAIATMSYFYQEEYQQPSK